MASIKVRGPRAIAFQWRSPRPSIIQSPANPQITQNIRTKPISAFMMSSARTPHSDINSNTGRGGVEASASLADRPLRLRLGLVLDQPDFRLHGQRPADRSLLGNVTQTLDRSRLRHCRISRTSSGSVAPGVSAGA